MSQCGRLVLAAFCCSLVLRLAGSEGSAESDGDAMARAAAPPPLKSAQSGADRYQPPQAQTLTARPESTASGPGIMGPRSPHNHTSKHRGGEIPAAHAARVLSKRPFAPSGYHKRRHLDGADLAARGEKSLDRQTVSSVMHDQAYAAQRDARLPKRPVALPLPPFGYNRWPRRATPTLLYTGLPGFPARLLLDKVE
jgi:hypothetical protein